MSSRQMTTSRLVKIAGLLIFLILVSLRGGGWAITSDLPLQVEGDRLTGHLSQVTLRTVLEQLQKQLGITYKAPVGELDKVISVDLEQAPILPALAKILAPWDYAFTVNSAGHVQFLYVTPKAPPSEGVSQASEPSDVVPPNRLTERELSPPEGSKSGRGNRENDLSLSHEREPAPISPPSSSASASPSGESPGFRAPVVGGPMAIQPVPAGTTMPMMPASGGSGMQVTPAVNPPNMPIIPATSYPPMDIQPVPGYLQEEMLRSIQP